jgi:hypothetical protein
MIDIKRMKIRSRMKTYSGWFYDSRWGFNMSYFVNLFSKNKRNWNLHEFLYDELYDK